jgi:uncharacterized membrane protein
VPTRQKVVNTLVRVVEIALIGLGVAFDVVNDNDASVTILVCWVVTAFAYLLFGALALRRSRLRAPDPAPREPLIAWRLNLLFGLVASLTGLTIALEVAASNGATDQDVQLEVLGAVAMILSWLLLHASFARQYETLLRRAPTAGGLRFPTDQVGGGDAGATPNPTDFLYFAFAVGSTFATSDVDVTTTRMRWHVMTHSVISFFYNAAVVAFAIAVLIGT